MMVIRKTRLFSLILTLALAGCTAQQSVVYHSPDAQAPPSEPSLLVLPPDVVVSRYTAGGIEEPRADWTATVTAALNDALRGHLYEGGTRFVDYGTDLHDQDLAAIRQINTLADAIELSRAAQSLGGGRVYQLGSAENARLREHEVDYVLLVVLKANRASAGRHATAVLGAMFGAVVETDSAQFRSILIDLRDGHVKWANFDRDALWELGDPLNADQEKWREAVNHLLTDFPL